MCQKSLEDVYEKINQRKKEISKVKTERKRKELYKCIHRLSKEVEYYKMNMRKYKANS